jgi:hypothetical protein
VRPLRSVIVTEITSGSRTLLSSNTFSIAKMAAFALSVSKIVSSSSRSAPPSIRPRTWSSYAARVWSKVMLRKAGLLTSGEIERVRFIGPMEPPTNRGLSGVLAVHSSTASRAILAPATFSS